MSISRVSETLSSVIAAQLLSSVSLLEVPSSDACQDQSLYFYSIGRLLYGVDDKLITHRHRRDLNNSFFLHIIIMKQWETRLIAPQGRWFSGRPYVHRTVPQPSRC
jgi:hypothetical protein